jgi:hypothetical protein
MSEDKIDSPSVTEEKSSWLRIFGSFWFADLLFVSIHQLIAPIPFSPNATLPLNVMRVIVAGTALYLAAFVAGMVLALIISLFTKEFGKEYRLITWVRALKLSSLPAAYLLYIAFLSRHHTLVS